jgi:branched-chain amino acid transport system permease protein
MTKTNMIALGVLVVMGFIPFFADSAWLAVGTTFLVYSVVAFSQDIILGRAGAFHMGHAAFFGLGAYATAILNTQYGWPILATWAPAVIIPMVVALITISPIIHLRGDYLLVATIGLNIIFIQVLENDLFGITGGPNGIFGIDVVRAFGYEFMSQTNMYYMAFILLGITLFIMKTLDSSKFGRAMFYINKDDIAAQSMGINVRYYKLYAFAIGAGLAGAAGSMFAVQYSAVSPEAFNVLQSIMFFTIVLVGGSASLPGVLLGTIVMFVLPEVFREFAEARYLVFGLAMILTMILRPRGIWPVKFGDIPSFLKKGTK